MLAILNRKDLGNERWNTCRGCKYPIYKEYGCACGKRDGSILYKLYSLGSQLRHLWAELCQTAKA